jgi:hypothetical protein
MGIEEVQTKIIGSIFNKVRDKEMPIHVQKAFQTPDR